MFRAAQYLLLNSLSLSLVILPPYRSPDGCSSGLRLWRPFLRRRDTRVDVVEFELPATSTGTSHRVRTKTQREREGGERERGRGREQTRYIALTRAVQNANSSLPHKRSSALLTELAAMVTLPGALDQSYHHDSFGGNFAPAAFPPSSSLLEVGEAFTAFFALSDVSPNGGALDVHPGTHKVCKYIYTCRFFSRLVSRLFLSFLSLSLYIPSHLPVSLPLHLYI